MTQHRAVFLDRDGTLNMLVERDGLRASPRYANQFRLLPDVDVAVERLHALGFLVFVVSNQPDVARGTLDRSELRQMMGVLLKAAPVDEIAVCPHDDNDACICRKPKPGLLTTLATRWDVDLTLSFMVGDSWKDVAAGQAAGCRTIYLGSPDELQHTPDAVATSLVEAVALIATNF